MTTRKEAPRWLARICRQNGIIPTRLQEAIAEAFHNSLHGVAPRGKGKVLPLDPATAQRIRTTTRGVLGDDIVSDIEHDHRNDHALG